MGFYRSNFPETTVIPKMHMLEAHVVLWLSKWQVGLGLMGEHGAESIHAVINNINPNYQNMPDKVQRLRCVLLEHHR